MSQNIILERLAAQDVKTVDERFVWKGPRVGTTHQGFPLYTCRNFFGLKQGPCIMVQDVLKVRQDNVRTNLLGRLHID